MSAENVRAVKEALDRHLEDVREVIGSETAAQKISFIQYKANVDAVVAQVNLSESLFDRREEEQEEEEDRDTER